MRYLVTALAVLVAVLSFRWPVSAVAHVVFLLPAALGLWYLVVTTRPVRPCQHCDRGRDWNTRHTVYGRRCSRCGATGERYSRSARVLVALGQRRRLRNLPSHLRPKDD